MKGSYPKNLTILSVTFVIVILFLALANLFINVQFRREFIAYDQNKVNSLVRLVSGFFDPAFIQIYPQQTMLTLRRITNAFDLEYLVVSDTAGNIIFDSRRYGFNAGAGTNIEVLFNQLPAEEEILQRQGNYVYRSIDPPLFVFTALNYSFGSNFDQIFKWHILYITLSLLFVGFLGIVLIRNLLMPMRYVSKAAEDFGVDMEKEGFVAETFNQIFKKLQQREKILMEFSAYIAHEFRNSIGTISGLARLVEKGKKPASSIIDECQVMEDLIQRFVEYARPLKLVTARIKISDLVSDVLAKATVPEKIKISSDLDPDICINGDYDLMLAAISNLLRNAIDAIEDEGRVKIETGEDDDHIYIAIQDSGIGIEAPDLDTIFNPFYSRKNQGIGLGLAYVKKIVELHNGRIEVQSEPGKGTEFTILIPKSVA